MNILVGITGSSSAKVSCKLVNQLAIMGHCVQVVFTQWGEKLYVMDRTNTEWVLEEGQGQINFIERKDYDIRYMFPEFKMALNIHNDNSEEAWYRYNKTVLHVELAEWADVMVIAPCTSNTLAKINNGISDNLLTSIVRVFEKELYVAPAMNTKMLKKAIKQGLLHSDKYKTLWPTTKKLTCGAFGLGAMADIEDIANIVVGDRWNKLMIPYNWHNGSPLICGVYSHAIDGLFILGEFPHPGWFGSVRKHDIHAGVDLYCEPNFCVTPFEDGEIISIGQFTGEKVGSPWWNDTEYVSVKGRSGIIVYGEILSDYRINIGDKVHVGTTQLGQVKRVLKHMPKNEIYGHMPDMLHIELLSHDAPVSFVSEWKHGEDRPKWLKDPGVYLGCLK